MHYLLKITTIFLTCLFPFAIRAGEVTVAVAANFTDASRDLVVLFERQSGHTVKVSFGSTGKLYAQIGHGAPYEVFLAADSARPLRAEQAGLAVAGSRFTYARGRLALWLPHGAADNHGSVRAWLEHAGQSRRIAIANPKTAPYGMAAQQVMKQLGIWQELKGHIVQGDSIAQTFQFVVTGNVDGGFVAASQLKSWKVDAERVWEVPDSLYAPIDQQAVLLARGRENPAAVQFLAFLKSKAARRVIAGYGYGVAE